MRLTDWERDRLTVFAAAELARRHRAAGLLLNAPEATALICDVMFQAARADASYEDIERAAREAVTPSQCIAGVPSLVDEVRMEVLMGEGTRLVVVLDPIGRQAGDIVPGEVVLGSSGPPQAPARDRRRIPVRNGSRRTVSVSSHFPFHDANARLDFDREQARGFRLDLAAGDTLDWAPGQERMVDLIAFGGTGGDSGDEARPVDGRPA